MESLSLATLAALPAGVAHPGYDVAAVPVGIVHLGLGAFHRAHQAIYTDSVLRRDPRWGICGVSLKTPHATRALAAQDGLYTALEKDASGTRARVVGALREALFLGAERDRVIARIADPNVHIVTLTVTEKGYCHDPATGAARCAPSRHRPGSRAARRGDQRSGFHRGGSECPTRGGCRCDLRRLLRQSSAQRSRRRGDRRRVCPRRRSRAGGLDRAPRHVFRRRWSTGSFPRRPRPTLPRPRASPDWPTRRRSCSSRSGNG